MKYILFYCIENCKSSQWLYGGTYSSVKSAVDVAFKALSPDYFRYRVVNEMGEIETEDDSF